ncbi:MAG: hypothetical protein AAF221_02170 [Pseudomonadota bacterium]
MAIKRLPIIAGVVLAMIAGPALAQDDISLAGTLKKRQAQLVELFQGHFTNKEQAAFSKALTPPGAEPFDAVLELTVTQEEGRLRVTSSNTDLAPILWLDIVASDETLSVTAQGDKPVCSGAATALLDGFEVTFAGRKNKNCPFGERLTVLPYGLQLAATKERPALPMTRANEFSCWVTLPRKNGEGWFFKAGVPLHDQGGETWVDTDETPPQRVGLKMRQAVWPYGRSRPSLVLYVHKPENPDKAASYTWANPQAERIGINLRWMQASCSKDASG